MKTLKITFFLACTMVAMGGCLDNTGPEPTVITEPSARSYYYIANQSESDLSVTYKIAFLPMDSTVAVPADSTTQIFESGGISSSPSPSEALANLRFYKLSGDTTSPIFTIEPVVDENWDVSTEYVPGDAVTKYKLVVTEEDFN